LVIDPAERQQILRRLKLAYWFQFVSTPPALFFFFIGIGMVTQGSVFDPPWYMKLVGVYMLLSNVAYLPVGHALMQRYFVMPPPETAKRGTWLFVGATLVFFLLDMVIFLRWTSKYPIFSSRPAFPFLPG